MELSKEKIIEKKSWEKPDIQVLDFNKTEDGWDPGETEDSAYNLASQ